MKYFLLLGFEAPQAAFEIYEHAEIFRRHMGNLDLVVNVSARFRTRHCDIRRGRKCYLWNDPARSYRSSRELLLDRRASPRYRARHKVSDVRVRVLLRSGVARGNARLQSGCGRVRSEAAAPSSLAFWPKAAPRKDRNAADATLHTNHMASPHVDLLEDVS